VVIGGGCGEGRDLADAGAAERDDAAPISGDGAAGRPEYGARYRALLDPKRTAEIDRYFRKSVAGALLGAADQRSADDDHRGFRSNVIPSEAEAMIDVRALPDEDMTKFVAELRR